jgi:hypothetical protein
VLFVARAFDRKYLRLLMYHVKWIMMTCDSSVNNVSEDCGVKSVESSSPQLDRTASLNSNQHPRGLPLQNDLANVSTALQREPGRFGLHHE